MLVVRDEYEMNYWNNVLKTDKSKQKSKEGNSDNRNLDFTLKNNHLYMKHLNIHSNHPVSVRYHN